MIKNRRVDYQDRDLAIEYLRMALGMHGIRMEYVDIELIYQTIKMLDKKGGDLDLKEVSKIRSTWEVKWNNYFKGHNVTVEE